MEERGVVDSGSSDLDLQKCGKLEIEECREPEAEGIGEADD
jgi:hypothetical protein